MTINSIGSGNLVSMLCIPGAEREKALYFSLRQLSILARPQSLAFEKADRYPSQLNHRVADPVKHLPKLLVTAFVKNYLKPAVTRAFSRPPNPGGSRTCFVNEYTASQTIQLSIGRSALDLDLVTFRYVRRCPRDQVRKVAVIGQQ
jgi:hypothetical protein